MEIGALIIGDEILSGKRQDKHFAFLINTLRERGLELSWASIVGDDPVQLKRQLRCSLESDALVFSFGGIGATPDDRTRQCVAEIIDRPLTPHPEAIAEIEERFGESAYPNRVLMGHFPSGAAVIPNPVNRVPGFQWQRHYFMPGFPEMAWPMVEWILNHHYPDLRQTPRTEKTIYVINGRESDLLALMNRIVADYPDLRLASLPHLGKVPHIEISLRGDETQVRQAMSIVKTAIAEAGFEWQHQLPSTAQPAG